MTVASTPVEAYLDQLAATSAVPGGGSAAALAAAMGAALLGMVSGISVRKTVRAEDRTRLLALVPEFEELRRELLRLSQDDIDAYQAVLDARKRGAPEDERGEASLRAAEVPLETARSAARALALYPDVSKRAWEMTRSDLETGKGLLEVAMRAALANVAVNLPDLPGPARSRIEGAYADLTEPARG